MRDESTANRKSTTDLQRHNSSSSARLHRVAQLSGELAVRLEHAMIALTTTVDGTKAASSGEEARSKEESILVFLVPIVAVVLCRRRLRCRRPSSSSFVNARKKQQQIEQTRNKGLPRGDLRKSPTAASYAPERHGAPLNAHKAL